VVGTSALPDCVAAALFFFLTLALLTNASRGNLFGRALCSLCVRQVGLPTFARGAGTD